MIDPSYPSPCLSKTQYGVIPLLLCSIPVFVQRTCVFITVCMHLCTLPRAYIALSIPKRCCDKSNLVVIVSSNVISFTYVYKLLRMPYVHCEGASEVGGVCDAVFMCQTESKMSLDLNRLSFFLCFPSHPSR